MHLREFVDAGRRRSSASTAARTSRSATASRYGVSVEPRRRRDSRVVGSLLRTKLVDDASPIVYGVPDNLAVYSDSGDSFSVSATAAAAGAAAAAAAAARAAAADAAAAPGARADRPRHAGRSRRSRRAGRSSKPHEPGAGAAAGAAAVAVRAADRGAAARRRSTSFRPISARAWRCASPSRTSCSCPACSRAAPTSRSGRSSSTCRSSKGHVVLFANNPIYRGETHRQLLHGVQHDPELRQSGRRKALRRSGTRQQSTEASGTSIDRGHAVTRCGLVP